tara:strand:+ start:439 stop:570 length:132 start_codon:yes stop_codon:yes gene_type:complete
MNNEYKVMVKSGNVWVKLFTGDYNTCQWFAGTQRNPARVELNI